MDCAVRQIDWREIVACRATIKLAICCWSYSTTVRCRSADRCFAIQPAITVLLWFRVTVMDSVRVVILLPKCTRCKAIGLIAALPRTVSVIETVVNCTQIIQLFRSISVDSIFKTHPKHAWTQRKLVMNSVYNSPTCEKTKSQHTRYYDPSRLLRAAILSCADFHYIFVALCDHDPPTLQTYRQTDRRIQTSYS